MNIPLTNGTHLTVQAFGSRQVVLAVPVIVDVADARQMIRALQTECEEAERRLAMEKESCD